IVRNEAGVLLLLGILDGPVLPAVAFLLRQPAFVARGRRCIRVRQMELHPGDDAVLLPALGAYPIRLRVVADGFAVGLVRRVRHHRDLVDDVLVQDCTSGALSYTDTPSPRCWITLPRRMRA